MSPFSSDSSSHLTQKIYIVARPGFEPRAELLSHQLNLSVLPLEQLSETVEGFALIVDGLGLSLQLLGKNAPGPVRCDFVAGAAKHRRIYGGGKGQDIAKAVGLNHRSFKPQVLDITAGLGRDGFVLASLGASVLMVERHPIVFALLADGLARGREQVLGPSDYDNGGNGAGTENEDSLADILNRINTVNQDASAYLKQLGLKKSEQTPKAISPDVVYIDPMFPAREKSGKVKKEMQLFHQLVGVDGDSAMLLPLALEVARYRVVVKRSIRAPFLAEQKPGYSLKGKSTRFDIYPIKKLP